MELAEVAKIPLDKKEIRQLILNLVLNGSQAMSPGGTMKISTFMSKGDVVLSVQDDVSKGTTFFSSFDLGQLNSWQTPIIGNK